MARRSPRPPRRVAEDVLSVMCGTRPLPAIYTSLRDVCTCQPIGYAIALNNHKATRPFALAAHICMAWYYGFRMRGLISRYR
jgi:hypothetical protein